MGPAGPTVSAYIRFHSRSAAQAGYGQNNRKPDNRLLKNTSKHRTIPFPEGKTGGRQPMRFTSQERPVGNQSMLLPLFGVRGRLRSEVISPLQEGRRNAGSLAGDGVVFFRDTGNRTGKRRVRLKEAKAMQPLWFCVTMNTGTGLFAGRSQHGILFFKAQG